YVLARASRAVHGANNCDVVPRAVAAIPAIIALEESRFSRRRWRWWTITAKGVIALESSRAYVVNVNMAAGRNVFPGEDDNLSVLVDRFALIDIVEGDLV